jgi:hypothetical protein
LASCNATQASGQIGAVLSLANSWRSPIISLFATRVSALDQLEPTQQCSRPYL